MSSRLEIREKAHRDWLRKVDANAKARRLLSDEQRRQLKADYNAGMPRQKLIEKYRLKDLNQLYNQTKRLHASRKYLYWNKRRLTLLKAGFEQGTTDKEMMALFPGKTERAIATARRRAGILSKIKWTEQQLLRLEGLKLQGLSDAEAAKEMGTTPNAIQLARLSLLALTQEEVNEYEREETSDAVGAGLSGGRSGAEPYSAGRHL